jgi:hypothetical protein
MIDTILKDKLMGALQSSVDSINTGMPARKAVVKSALDADFNVEQSRRLCELFNTARTLYHFERNPGNKEASFELIDADEVLGDIFTAPGITPKIAEDAVPDYTEYAGPELMARDGMVVEAAADLWPAEAEELPSLDMQATRAYRIIDTQLGLAKQAQSECRQAEIHAARSLSKLAYAVKQSFAADGPARYARFLRSREGTEYQPILAHLSTYLPAYVKVGKADLDACGRVVEDRDLGAWFEQLEDARQLEHQASASMAMANTVEKEAKDFERAFLDTVGASQRKTDVIEELLAPFVEKRSAGGGTGGAAGGTHQIPTVDIAKLFGMPESREEIADAFGTKSVPAGTPIRDRIVGGVAKPVGAATQDYVLGGLKSLRHQGVQENKTITERLKNQQREVLLQDLMTRDPFISEADPQAVANGYLTIMQVAPEVSVNKEVVRAVLRQLIHTGALSTFDASSLADLEKTIRETAGTLPTRQVAAPRQ